MAEIPVPQEVRDAVIREVYRQADSLDWEEISARQKTRHYSQWVEDPAIGGELADYYTAEGMRVWLKDGPLKEYARALEDFGPFAQYATHRLSPPSEFIPEVLGAEWAIVPASIGEKPMHCLATNGTKQRYVCWGKPRTYRDLLWAAVNKALTTTTRPMIVIYLNEGKTVSANLERLHERIAEHCSLDLAYVRRRREDREPT